MRYLKRLSFFLIACAIMCVPWTVEAEAACSHTSLGTRYSDASHPHAYFRFCNSCGEKVYIGGYETKEHGDGTWGSGTCPSCGTHTYIGRTCTSNGTCACGDTIAPYGHTYGTTVYYELAHPHNNFRSCTRCGAKSYTGTSTTLTHGNGTSGTCRSCGSHSYSPSFLPSVTHPHESVWSCDCGSSYTTYPLQSTCSVCTANSTTTTSSTPTTGILSYVDGDQGYGTVIFVPVTYYVEYTNTYNHPSSGMLDYNYPAFASFGSRVTSHCEGQAAYVPAIICVSSRTVNYYNSSGSNISTQSLIFAENTDAIANMVHTISSNPYYAVGSATCNVSGSANHITGSTTAYFS